jgi:hypothetical protein
VRCERARQWASLGPDGELSSLEEQLLTRHLAGCEPCRSFEEGVRSATELLRTSPAERPARRFQPARRSVDLPLERRRTALVVAVALVLGAVVGSLLERPSAPVPQAPAPQVGFLSRDLDQLRELPRVPRKSTPAPVPSGPPNPPEGVI